MKAIVIEAPGALVVRDAPEPSCGPDEVLVRTRMIGICHSDFDVLDGRYFLPSTYPLIPGHEWCGEVVEVGPSVRGFRAGERVVGEAGIGDFDHFGLTTNGAGAEYCSVPARLAHRLPDELDEHQGALVEPFTIVFRALAEVGWVEPGAVVAIVGAGTIGLATMLLARASGATTVSVDPLEARRDLARRLGADHVIDPGEGPAEGQFRDLTGEDGAEVVVEASGTRAGMELMASLAANRGRIAVIGLSTEDPTPIRMREVNAKQLRIWGINGSGGYWPQALRCLVRAGIDLRPLVGETFPLAQAVRAFETARDLRRGTKVHIEVGGPAPASAAG